MLQNIIKGFLICLCIGFFLDLVAQTNNYFGTSGALNGSTWSTNPAGPYDMVLNTSGGGAIINFGNNATCTGGSITVAGINATANLALSSSNGTISNQGNSIISIDVADNVTLDFGSQSFTSSNTAGYIKAGNGVLALSGNVYGGGFKLNGGTVILRGVNAMGGNPTLNSLEITNGIIAANGNRDLSGKYPGGISILGDFTLGATTGLSLSSANLIFSNNVSLGNGSTRTITIGGTGLYSFTGEMSGEGSNLIINSTAAGIISLSGANTYSGTTTILSGTLRLERLEGNTLPPSNNIIVNGGILIIEKSQVLNNLTIASGASVMVSDLATLTITGTVACESSAIISGEGNFNLTSGATLITANASGVPGSIIVSGTKTFEVGANYEFRGASTGGFPVSGNNVTINNPSGVILSTNFTVNGTLSLSNGKLFLEDRTLTIGAAGSIAGASNSNYIVTNGAGKLKRNSIAATAKDFPIGSTNYYAPVSIANSGAVDNFSAAFIASAPTCFNASQQEESVTGTWDISEDDPGGSDCSLSIDFGSVPAGNGFVNGDAAIAHCNGATIDHVSVTNVAGTTVTGTGFTSFSPFGVGNEAALPIELISFIVRPFQNQSILTWQTASELNNSHFSIEKSADGEAYREIAQVPGQGNSFEVHKYEYIDESPYPGLNYYRLKQVDFDGRYSYSPVVSVDFQAKGKMVIYPNPFSDEITLTFNEETAHNRQILLFDQTGRMVQTMELIGDELTKDLNTSNLSPGTYILKVQSGQHVEMHRLVKL
jgi:autotransporter-associated beta strand protein